MIKFCLLLCMIAYGAIVQADIKVPQRLFKMTGADVNVSEGDLLYKSQAAGYYSGGGGIVVRSPVKNTKFVSVAFPNLNDAGCGGIDIYNGGFSFVNSKQLVEAIQAIASNSAGYAFMLGMESISPTTANTLRQMQSWANTINGIGINSCETAAALVGSVWPANEMASQHICRTIGTNSTYRSFLEGRHQCSGSSEKRIKKEMENFLPLGEEHNIAWEALKKQPFFQESGSHSLAEMYMTLVGTIVIRKDMKPEVYFSKVEDGEFLRKLLEGGIVTKYKCKDPDKCLDVMVNSEDLEFKDSWFAKIRNTLHEMQQKIISDEPLDSSERGLLSTTRLPLFKMMNVLTAYHHGYPSSIEMDEIADIVTWDVLAQVVYEAIETVRRGCNQLMAESAYQNSDVIRYLNDIERVRNIVKRYEDHAQKAMDLEMRLIQKIQLLEKNINSEIMVR